MSNLVEDFIVSPSEALLELFTKDQLFKIADHYEIELEDKRLKESTIRETIKTKLIEQAILIEMSDTATASQSKPPVNLLTFEQQERLLLLQLEQERVKLEMERERNRIKQTDIELQKYRLDMIREGRMDDGSDYALQGASKMFDTAGNLRLMPKFSERDPDTFFTLFERIAEARGWPSKERTLLLQCVFTGRAQEVYSSLPVSDCNDYDIVKAAVLKSYELVPEAYRQKFRTLSRGVNVAHVEFARELSIAFNRWCMASEVTTVEELTDLIVLEQFKNSVPARIATYINEQKADTAAKAAELADDYVLTHKSFEFRKGDEFFENKGDHMSRNSSLICNYCHGKGHWKNECPVLKAKGRGGKALRVKPAALVASVLSPVDSLGEGFPKSGNLLGNGDYAPFITYGHVSMIGTEVKIPVTILRDTGASESFILEDVLPFSFLSDTGTSVLVRGIGLDVMSVPLHRVTLSSELVSGEVVIGVRPSLPVDGVDIIMGNNLAGDKVWPDTFSSPVVLSVPLPGSDESHKNYPEVFTACAVTRSMTSTQPRVTSDSAVVKPFSLPDNFSVSPSELLQEQQLDSSLHQLFERVMSPEEIRNVAHGYFLQDGILVRKWIPHGSDFAGDPIIQVVVPEKYRSLVLQISHDKLAGHLGVKKTYHRILCHFFWPKLKKDVSQYIKTCHTCQLTGKPNQKIKPAPLFPIPAVSPPFEHLIIDCVGPLPRSKSGSIYLLTVMCASTRYPAAYPLRTITAKSVVKALTQFISIFGIPKIVQSDQGSNFTSHLFSQVLKLLHIKHNKASAYHAQSQGALERFHQTLKSLLRSYCTEMEGDWEQGLPWLMLSAREVCQESTGFSPNDLVFGHTVRGPLAVLRDQWVESAPPKNLQSYVNDFKRRLYEAGKVAKEQLHSSQKRMKTIFDRRTEERKFMPGDQVLALLPVEGSPFQAQFTGPYVVEKQVTDLNYLIATPERRKSTQLCHVNLLKPYYCRSHKMSNDEVKPALVVGRISLVGEGVDEGVSFPEDTVLLGRLKNSETLKNVHKMLAHLPDDKCGDLIDIINHHVSLFGDVPSRTHWLEHDIDVGDSEPIRQNFYRVSPNKLLHLNTEVQYMLDHDIARPSFSSWASPCLLVNKSDGTYRFCTDYRRINRVTKPDSFPLPRIEDCVDRVGSAKFVSKFDLLKGYWQVPLTKRAQEISTFITSEGLFSYNVMSFGLRNAPATFQRLMNRVVSGLEGVAVYLDDVVVFSDSWEQHLEHVADLFSQFEEAGLTVNLAKCEFAKATVTYLGKVVGQGCVRPVRAKVEAIDQFPSPTTKKELMRFLGLVGYYRGFCRNFSTVVAPLTDLLKAKAAFVWTSACQVAFQAAKSLLTSTPVLAAPRFDRSFQVCVDASNVGAGAVLLQADEEGIQRPVSYFSKKFNSYQLNYSVVEKETLALIWALQHFEVYVGSVSDPLVVYTDHNPLVYLHSLRCPNQRLTRWCLFLQSYALDIRHIKGTDNVVADALSRAPYSF
uniref:Gypsy retrotransposon integrase-like protein 1 n=1 Tax=Cyprinus carpio TaxID=7962 RepID=A0A8C1I8K6_CYPCA